MAEMSATEPSSLSGAAVAFGGHVALLILSGFDIQFH
jgi:hypothetical protein